MNDLYSLHPHFIDSDPRKSRTKPYPVTAHFMQARHESIFKNIDFHSKRILDLGCCVGYTGAWALVSGATHYHGIEFSKELSEIACQNLSKSFDKSTWQITNSSVEDFLDSNHDKFDIVVAMGVAYSFKEPVSFIEKILTIGSAVIVESSHHKDTDVQLNTIKDTAFVSYAWQGMNYNNTASDAIFYSARPSESLVKTIFKFNGFSISEEENNLVSACLPEHYGLYYNKRFVVVGSRVQDNTKPMGYVNSIRNKKFEIRDWK